MRVIWSKEARNDLIEIRRFIEEQNPRAAERMAKRVLDVVEHLERNPRMGRDGFIPQTRELAVTGTPYLVVYELLADRVHVLGLVHGKRDRTPEPDD